MNSVREAGTQRGSASIGTGTETSLRAVRKARLRKREIALSFAIGALAAFAIIGILSDGFGGPGSYFADDPALESGSPASR